jgi:ribonuclease HI
MFISKKIAILYTSSHVANPRVPKESKVGAWAFSLTPIPVSANHADHKYIASFDAEVATGVGIPDMYEERYYPTDRSLAILAAIRAVHTAWKMGYLKAIVYCDDSFVVSCITNEIHEWRKNRWKTRLGTLRNKGLWIDLYSLVYDKGIDVDFKYVSRRVDTPNNFMVARLANDAAMSYLYSLD